MVASAIHAFRLKAHMIWLAVDPGTVRLGLAIGSRQTGIASPVRSVPAEPRPAALTAVKAAAAEYGAGGIVVGLPINMDGTEGPQAAHARELAAAIATATGLEVRLWDERLSSFSADRKLAGRLTRGKRRARQDAIAAAEFLQDFLDRAEPR